MCKILIVNNNLDTGGIQKSLVNFLKANHKDFDITLMLLSKSGSLLNEIPKDIKVISPNKCYRILGLNKEELKKYPFLFVLKAFLIKFSFLFSRKTAMKLLGMFQKKITGYDIVISYSHLFDYKYFANGSGDFVLDKTVSNEKICIIHCDYLNSGTISKQNNSRYFEFDEIACCSDSVRERFLKGSNLPSEKVYTLRNFYDFDIIRLAKENPFTYSEKFINIVSVARLSPEKGVDRAVEALHLTDRKDIHYYIIGDGPQKDEIKKKIAEYKTEDRIFLLGEQENPYRYMINADYLLVPSLHEAAPMVFDEAKILGLPVISTDTTSAEEMIGEKYGIVIENSEEGIRDVLNRVKKSSLKKFFIYNNSNQVKQLKALIIS